MQEPSGFALFVMTFIALSIMLGLICLNGWLQEHWHEIRPALFPRREPTAFLSSRSMPPEERAPVQIVLPRSDAANRTNEPAELAGESKQNAPPPETFVLNADELPAIARMIEHKVTAEKPTKVSTIWAGFAVKKGESAKYRRASLIYDALFVIPNEPPPPRYPALTEEQQRTREVLELGR
jgi:hypothetical protein